MADKVEGTFHLDGLLEGCFFSDEDEQHVRSFVNQIRQNGFDFYLKVDRDRFSLLPSERGCRQKKIDVSVDSFLKRRLEAFFEHYAPQERAKFVSTLRSVEYLEGFEVQAIYGIDSNGGIVVEKRTVQASTTPPQKPLSLKQKMQCYGIIVIVLLVAVLISSFFVPYKDIAKSLWGNIKPYDVKQLELSLNSYSNLIQPKEIVFSENKSRITLVFDISPDFPSNKEALNRQWVQATEDMEKKLTLESIARNMLRCNLFDKDGKHYANYSCMLVWNEDRTGFSVSFPFSKQLGSIELSY